MGRLSEPEQRAWPLYYALEKQLRNQADAPS